MRKQRNSFSLFEILLVMALIAIALGVVSIQIPRAIQKASFEKGVEAVIAKASLAQEFMINHQTDVILVLEQNDSLLVQIKPQKPTTKKMMDFLNRESKIKGIHEISLNGEKRKRIELVFESSSLVKTPRGILRLSYKDLSASLVFKGYPCRIQKGDVLEDEKQAHYPEEILSTF